MKSRLLYAACLVGVLGWACSLPIAAAPAPSQDRGQNGLPFPSLNLPALSRGADILGALGNRLPEVAAFYGEKEETLRAVARSDRALHADRSGRLLYVCEGLNLNVLAGEGALIEAAPAFPTNQTFLLHSRPAATRKIYLDFNGHTTSGTSWNNNFTGGTDIVTPAYDIDGDRTSLSATELERIQRIWQRVTEDFAMLDADVTTEDPGVEGLRKVGGGDTSYGIRICIGGNGNDWYGSSAGGVAYIGSFNWSSDTPGFVFPENLAGGQEKAVAEAVSHETGHTLGLYHDGLTDGTSYYSGHGSGATSWAPIMGVGYSRNVTQWSKGEYLNASNTEDDLVKMLSYGVSVRADDHGNATGTATALAPSASLSASGNIELSTDTDVFAFQSGSGLVTLTVNAATPSPNLDLMASLFNSAGSLVVSTNPAASLGLTLQVTVTNGTYYLALDGVGTGDATTGYSDYASIGQYTMTGTVPNPSTSQPPAVPTNFRITSVTTP